MGTVMLLWSVGKRTLNRWERWTFTGRKSDQEWSVTCGGQGSSTLFLLLVTVANFTREMWGNLMLCDILYLGTCTVSQSSNITVVNRKHTLNSHNIHLMQAMFVLFWQSLFCGQVFVPSNLSNDGLIAKEKVKDILLVVQNKPKHVTVFPQPLVFLHQNWITQ